MGYCCFTFYYIFVSIKIKQEKGDNVGNLMRKI